jgi:hypothetical protein
MILFEPPVVTPMRKVTRNFTENEGSMPPTTSAASAQAGKPAADREGDGEDAFDIDPHALRDARVIDRRPELGAETGFD